MSIKRGFTLVELLVVISILGILAVIGLTTFNSTQARGRDAARKSDLKAISSALELYYNDYGRYPESSDAGEILGCPSTTQSVCSWGSGQFTDGTTIYMREIPHDPTSGYNYYYISLVVGGLENQGYQLFAELENLQDTNACIGGDCQTHSDLPASADCGGLIGCNFAATSPNVSPTDGGGVIPTIQPSATPTQSPIIIPTPTPTSTSGTIPTSTPTVKPTPLPGVN